MELAFFVIGMLFIITGLKNTQGQFWTLLEQDLVGSGGFFVWAGLLSIIWIGSSALKLETAGKALMFLLIFVYVVKNPQAITGISTGVSNTSTSPATSLVSQGAATTVSGATAQNSTGAQSSPATPSSNTTGTATPGGGGGGASGIFGSLGSLFGGK